MGTGGIGDIRTPVRASFGCECLKMCGDDACEVFAANLIVIVETRQIRAVEIENADHPVSAKQWDDQFRA